jgi:AraC-like DNA-binding protein
LEKRDTGPDHDTEAIRRDRCRPPAGTAARRPGARDHLPGGRAAAGLVEAVLLEQMTGPLAPDPLVAAAAGGLSAGVPVGEVATALGVLPRTLRRRFTAQVGLSPKRFARVQRLQRVVRDLDGQVQVDWAAVAARHGYADQPHLVEEFRQLVGVTPTGYLRSRINGTNHLRFDVADGGLTPGSRYGGQAGWTPWRSAVASAARKCS